MGFCQLVRYVIVVDDHEVLGKVMQVMLKSYVTDMDENKCVVYGRVLSGVLYTSGLYHCSEVSNDSVVRLRIAEIGTILPWPSRVTVVQSMP